MKVDLTPAPFRPETRRLAFLDNDELALVFQKRADALSKALTGHVWWDSKFQVYWSKFLTLQDQLYEVMMEIQSRYPAKEISYHRTIPVMEPRA